VSAAVYRRKVSGMSPAGPLHEGMLRVDAAGDGLRADVFLARAFPHVSRTRLKQKVQMGEAFLNGKRFATSTRLRTGDTVTILWQGAPTEHTVTPHAVLWEDDALLAIDKPAGVASHPMGRIQSGTVVQFARQRHAEEIRRSLETGDGEFYPTLINRLDTFTSGIVLVAKTRSMHRIMQDLVVRRLVSKEYCALVEGLLAENTGRIDFPIGPDPRSAIRVKRARVPEGLPSVTLWEVVRRLEAHTLVRAFPLTGRQHQIRVHFAGIGHPVLGDLLYKDESLFLRYQQLDGAADESLPSRHYLHAARLGFTHPLSGHAITIESPLPEDFLKLVSGPE